MTEKRKFGFLSQGYVAPRADNVALHNEGLLCASIMSAGLEDCVETIIGDWGGRGGIEGVSQQGGGWGN